MNFVEIIFSVWNNINEDTYTYMLKEARHSKILQALKERQYLSLNDLVEITNSSESSVRADLVTLANEGKLIRLRGGARALDDAAFSYEPTFESNIKLEVDGKKRIAEYAASLVKEDSIIYIDAGTSTYYLVDALKNNKLTVVTNSVILARHLKLKGYQVYITGGEFKLTTDAFIGMMTREILSKFNFDMGFFGCNGIDLEKGLTTPDYEEAVVKNTAMNCCRQVYVLADHTKLGVKTSVTFHPFKGEEIIIDRITKKEFKNKGMLEVNKWFAQ